MKKIFLILALLLIVGGLLGYFIFLNVNNNVVGNIGDFFVKNNSDVGDKDNGEVNTGTGSGGGGGSGSSSSGGDSSSAGANAGSKSNSSCVETQISYSIGEVNTYSSCIDFENNVCIKNNVNCSTEIRNLDNANVVFNVEFIFYEKEDMENVLGTKSVSLFLNGGQFKFIMENLILEGENAIKNISCHCNTIKSPVKCV